MSSPRRAALAAALMLVALPARHATAQQLITNGGFETGTLAGWTVQDQTGSNGTFIATSSLSLPPPANPFRPTIGPDSGFFYAVSDEGGNGTHALLQSFTVPGPAATVILSFDMFVDNYASGPSTPATLDYTTAGANQQARVDLLTGGASAFTVGSGVLKDFYDTTDPVTNPLLDNPHLYTHYSFDITSLVGSGGTFQLRFAEANNQDTLYQGVDNVSVFDTPAATPEPSQSAALGLGIFGVGGLALAARRRQTA